MNEAPIITTERLRLRPHRMSDLEAIRAFYKSDRSCYVDAPQSETHLWYGFSSEVGSWALCGQGAWAIDTQDGQFIGQVSIAQPPHFPELELGWILFDGHEGHGYAHEAAKAARDYAFVVLDAPTLVSYIDKHNARSIALAKRLGAVLDPDAEVYDEVDVVYRHQPGGGA